MANIYKQQQTSNLAHKVYSAEGNPAQSVLNYGEQMQKQSQQYEDKAKVTYANAIEVEASNVMNELINDPALSANPVLLEEKMNSAFDKMAADIVDDDVKIDFLAKSSVKKSSYLNKAYANAKKVQDERYKSSLFDKIYSDIDLIGMTFSNGMYGVSNEDDVLNAVIADQDLIGKINSVNSDGTYVFSDEQRLNFRNDRDKVLLTSFKTSFDGMTEEQRNNVLNRMEDDLLYIGNYKDKDGEMTTINLKDVVSQKTYSEFKEFAKKERENETKKTKKMLEEANLAERVRIFENEKALSAQLDVLPTDDALKLLRKNENGVSKDYYKAKEDAILSSKGITAETREDVARELALGIEILNKSSEDEGVDFLKQADAYLIEIEKKYAEGYLSPSDKRRLTNQMMKGVSSELPNVETEWFAFGYEYADAYEDMKNNLTDITKADALFMEYFREREKGDYSGEQKKNLAMAMIKKTNEREFNVKIFKNNDELKEAIQNGFVSNGETVYVGGKRGTVEF